MDMMIYRNVILVSEDNKATKRQAFVTMAIDICRPRHLVHTLAGLLLVSSGTLSFSPNVVRDHRTTLYQQLQRHNNRHNNELEDSPLRRTFIRAGAILLVPLQSHADETFTRQTKDFSYVFTPPPNFTESKKPLPTHLDEVNFISSDTKGYQFGITVDPVRIQSLREFGSPEEVAAKVVMAEVNRDGVLDVTLVGDPVALNDNTYLVDYVSKGKRGNKHFVCKIIVQSGKLHVLTAQALEDTYDGIKKELTASIESFRALS